MDVKEKRNELKEMCAEIFNCNDCALNREHCTYDAFTEAPDEQIEIWHGKAFPEPVNENKRVFTTGAVRDNATGKGRFDLLPWAAIWEVAKHCERGATHYGTHNVDKGIPTSVLLDSGIRHICRHLCGDTDEPHLVAAAWNLLWAVQMCITHPELVDTPWREA